MSQSGDGRTDRTQSFPIVLVTDEKQFLQLYLCEKRKGSSAQGHIVVVDSGEE